jgi:hypothetical protein
LLHTQLGPLKRDEDGTIGRQGEALDPPQSKATQTREQLLRRIEAELELRRIGPQAETREERANCCTCSG